MRTGRARRSLAWVLLLALAWPVGAAAAFPLRVSGNGRYLEDAGGAPWRVQAFAAWVMSAKGSTSDVPGYLDQLRSYGFNAIYLMAMVHGGGWSEVPDAPRNANGDAPFAIAGDFTTPNAAYWNHLDWMIDQCAARGIAVMLTPAYLGYPNTNQGWWAETDAQTQGQLQTYGTWIGTRYASKSNIIWFGL